MNKQAKIMQGQLSTAKVAFDDSIRSGKEQSARNERLTGATEKSASAAKKTANAMTDTTKITTQTLHSVQRAFLTEKTIDAKPTVIHHTSGDERLYEFLVTWENSGTTPAIVSSQYLNVQELTCPGPNDVLFRGESHSQHPSFVSPKGQMFTGPYYIPEKDIRCNQIPTIIERGFVQDCPTTLFVWGWAVYNDVFSPVTKPHVTEFCLRLAAINNTAPPDAPKIGFQWVTCDNHNCVDEYCKDYNSIIDMVSH